MEDFKASTQYADWQGSVQADDADNRSLQSFLKAKGILDDNSYAVAVKFYTGITFDKPWIRVVVADGTGFDSVNAQISAPGTLKFKEVDVDLTLSEFFELFKRFSIVVTSRDLGLADREYEIIK